MIARPSRPRSTSIDEKHHEGVRMTIAIGRTADQITDRRADVQRERRVRGDVDCSLSAGHRKFVVYCARRSEHRYPSLPAGIEFRRQPDAAVSGEVTTSLVVLGARLDGDLGVERIGRDGNGCAKFPGLNNCTSCRREGFGCS